VNDVTESAAVRRPRRPAAPTTPDPVEIAMEAEAGGRAVRGLGAEYLAEQMRLTRWQVANERAALTLKLLLGLAGVAAAGALALMAWTASRADGLVVEPFSVPPALAAQGVTGAAVAEEVLDHLGRLGRESRAYFAVQATDSWSDASHVEIPQTGVSLDEVNRLLRRSLGRQTYVSGTVRLVGDEIELTARAGQGEIVRARGPGERLPALAATLTEKLLANHRPAQWGRVLVQRQRYPEGEAVLLGVLRNASSAAEARDAHAALGNMYLSTGRRREAIRELRASTDLAWTYLPLAYAERGLGHHDAASRAAAQAVRRGSRLPGGRTADVAFIRAARSLAAVTTGDYAEAERQIRGVIGRQSGFGGQAGVGPAAGIENHIVALVGLHEATRGWRELPLTQTVGLPSARAESFRLNFTVRLAAVQGDWARALAAMEAGPPNPSGGHLETPTPDAWRALALAHLGRLAEARALAATLAPDCYLCWIHRGQIAELAGDRAAADAAFAEAVRQAPRAPFAQTAWAQAELARGRPDAAIARAKAAVRAGPRFADPQVAWAEALLAKGDAEAAAAKLAAAERYAPRWGRLHLKWGEALASLRRTDEARARWRVAASMDLTPAERARVTALLAGARA
jgi:tetratricopeptide (TPR) repeat protein